MNFTQIELMIVVRFEMVFELLVEYREHGSSSVAQLPNVILSFLGSRVAFPLHKLNQNRSEDKVG